MSNNYVTFNGPGIYSTLIVVLIILKLCKVISWSWWWVLAPIWAPIAIILVILIIAIIIALCMSK